LVDPSLVDLRSLGDEVRFRIFDYLWGKGVGSSSLQSHHGVATKEETLEATKIAFPMVMKGYFR